VPAGTSGDGAVGFAYAGALAVAPSAVARVEGIRPGGPNGANWRYAGPDCSPRLGPVKTFLLFQRLIS
jgi:hypothetical protein